jgi:hypothetical protein
MKQLHQDGQLNELQARFFKPTRPAEELYDLKADPFEINNLALNHAYTKPLAELRNTLYKWMVDSRDLGLIPEPIAEELGKAYANKYNILRAKENATLIPGIIRTIEAGEKKDLKTLRNSLKTGNDCERYWAATWLGVNIDRQAVAALNKVTESHTPALRIASLLALHRMDPDNALLKRLTEEVNHPNVIAGMYAMNAIEQTGVLNEVTESAADIGLKSSYEFTKRYAKRLKGKFRN